MRSKQNRAAILEQQFLERLNRVNVKVVGGFVKNQKMCFGDAQSG